MLRSSFSSCVLISKWILKQTVKISSKLCFGTAKFQILDSPRIETPVNLLHVFEGIHVTLET